jgi:dihydrofolate reductase
VAWVTGGTEIFNQSLAIAHVAEVTEIDADFEGDTPAPVLGPEWREVARERHVSATGVAYTFITYRNTSHGD